MANLKVITAARRRARETMWRWTGDPLTLRRRVYLVPGFTDEDGVSCWGDDVLDPFCFVTEAPEVLTNPRLATFVDFRLDGDPPHYEDFIRFGAHLARFVAADRAAAGGEEDEVPTGRTGEGDAGGEAPEGRAGGRSAATRQAEPAEVDLVCHSMGGLVALAAIALLDDYPELDAPPLPRVRNVITFDTPFLGFAAARNPLYAKLKRMQRPDEPWLMSQLLAMDTGSLRIAEVVQARNRFLGRVGAFWPRGADNTGGLIEVPHESASFGEAEDFAPACRDRYRGYRAWEDTSHSGAKGLTRDPRVMVEALEILTAD